MDKANRSLLHSWIFGIVVLFLGVALFAWTLVPYFQMTSYHQAIENAGSEHDLGLLLATFDPAAFMFEPETYVQGFVRQSFINQIIIQYNGGVFANKELRPLITSALKVGISYANAHPNPYYHINIAKLYDIQYALSGDESYFREAESYFRKALDSMPERQDLLSVYAVHQSIKKPVLQE